MEKQKTASKRKAATKVIVAVLLIAIMTGISFAVANFVHNRKSVQASSVKNGLSAYELAVQQGYSGSLDDWLVSLQGKSAYQIAVDNGYSGSEKDWSKTLTAMSKKDNTSSLNKTIQEKSRACGIEPVGINTENQIFDGCSVNVPKTDLNYAYDFNPQNTQDSDDNRFPGEKNNPAVSLEVPDIALIENTNGTMVGDYYYYFKNMRPYESYIKCIVTYKDGEKRYDLADIDKYDLKQQETSHWTAGNTYKLKVSCNGVETYANISIVKNPIKEINITDVIGYEGFLKNDGNMGYYENGISANVYSPKYTVTLDDGTVLESQRDVDHNAYVLIGNKEYELTVDKSQIKADGLSSLKAGSDLKINCELAGIKSSYNLKILGSPFKSLHIDDKQIHKVYDGNNYYYNIKPSSGFVELTNGKTVDLSSELIIDGKSFSGWNYSNLYYSNLNDEMPLEVGKIYQVEASLGSLKTTYNCEVVETDSEINNDIAVEKMEMISSPYKTEYVVGEIVDLRGAVIKLSFSDNSFENIKITELPDSHRGEYYLFSTKLKRYFCVCTKYSGGTYCFTSAGSENLEISAFGHMFEYPVTVKENTWKEIALTDYFTLNPKLIVTKEDGKKQILQIEEIFGGGGYGGIGPWVSQSDEIGSVAFSTDSGIFYVNIYTWEDSGKTYKNYYINNKKLKSNTLDLTDRTVPKAYMMGSDIGSFPAYMEEIYTKVCCGDYSDNYLGFLYSKINSITNLNGFYYTEEEFNYFDGTKKIAYFRFDENFNVTGYDFDVKRGDLDGSEGITDSDAIYLLMNSYFPADYPVNQLCDYNNDGVINDKDAIYLLMYRYFPEDYPIAK